MLVEMGKFSKQGLGKEEKVTHAAVVAKISAFLALVIIDKTAAKAMVDMRIMRKRAWSLGMSDNTAMGNRRSKITVKVRSAAIFAPRDAVRKDG